MKIILLLTCALTGMIARSQNYEIRATNKGNGVIGVEMRSTRSSLTTDNYITDMVFGLKWQSSYNVNLVSQITTMYNVKKSDMRKTKNAYYYQAFYAENAPFSLSAGWPQNTWVEIMRISNTLNSTGTGIFEVCEPGFDPTTNPNFGIDLTDYTPVINGSASAVVLPVGIIQFDARAVQKQIKVSWQTTTELNNKGFTIQRSPDGISFDSIGWVPGKINSYTITDYLFTDINVQAGMSYYYRLKQEDITGKISFSEIRSAEIKADKGEAFRLSPNPASSFLKVTYTGPPAVRKVRIKIIDSKGATVNDAEKIVTPGVALTIDILSIPGGQYYLVAEHDGTVLFSKAFQKL